MKLIKCTNLLVLGLALSIFTGCHGRRYNKVTDIPNPRTGTPKDDIGTKGIGGQAEKPLEGQPIPISNPDRTGWTPNAEILKAETVYFDFDQSAIKSGETSKIQHVADHLKKESSVAVRVEGNCDERGTEEYNRSLGEKRALAVREALVALGIAPDRIDTVSYGEDKPAAEGHTEAAWSKNRRADFVVLTPPK